MSCGYSLGVESGVSEAGVVGERKQESKETVEGRRASQSLRRTAA